METDSSHLIPDAQWEEEIKPFLASIEKSESQINEVAREYGGLIDLNLTYTVIREKLALALRLVKKGGYSHRFEMQSVAREQALGALDLVEELTTQTLSLNQKYVILDLDVIDIV